MALNYTSYISELTTLMVTQSTNPNFVAILPGIIDYAEQRIYRELDLLNTTVISTGTLAHGNRYWTLPTSSSGDGPYVTVISLSTISGGARYPATPVSQEFLDNVYGGSGAQGIPQFFTMLGQWSVILGPWPDQDYTCEVTGTIRPTPLSATNQTTFLTTYLPDLFIAASMVFASAYMRNFGAQADDPKMAQSWEQQFQTLKASANAEELRKKFAGPGHTSEGTAAAS